MENAKQEVAREIFADIDRMLDDIVIVQENDDDFQTTVIKTFEKVTDCIAELKKKYTEES